MNLRHLILPNRATRSIEILEKVCFWLNVQVLRVETGKEDRLPEAWSWADTAVHGGTSFCRQVAKALAARVAEPADDLLPRLPVEYTKRAVNLMEMGQARGLLEPKFIKPVNDKYFPAGIYATGAALPTNTQSDEIIVLVSEPVVWEAEYRTFVHDRQVKASSFYHLREESDMFPQRQEQARGFCEELLADPRVNLPRAVVIDVGYIKDVGWAVVEANTAVMSSLYDCDPSAVLKVLPYGLTPCRSPVG